MNSQNMNNSNNPDCSHYTESAENMGKISDFFTGFFWIHISKAFLYFLFMPEFISSYSLSAIDITVAYIISQVILTIIASYKEIYINKTRLSNIAISLMILIDAVSTIIHSGSMISICTITAIINEIVALKKTFDLRKLKQLKGYPLFSELLDNPKYIPPCNKIPNPVINSISLNLPQSNASHISVKIPHNKSHVSMQIPVMNNPESEKILVEDMLSEKSVKNNLFEIPLPADTPMEARLLGNATLDYKEFQRNNLQVEELSYDKSAENHKKINLSKDKKM